MANEEKRERLITAFADELLQRSENITPGSCMFFAGYLADRAIKEGWQWHPPVLEPQQEVDMMDRIISGLPTERLYDVNSLYPREVVVMDVVSKLPKITDKPGEFANISPRKDVPGAPHWSVIPNYENYEISRDGAVRSKWTKRVLDIEYRNCKSFVEMHDKNGFPDMVSTMELAQIAEDLFS